MTFPLPVPAELRAALPPGTGVLVGLSGGVDSSVALAMLAHLGCRVEAVTLKNFCTAAGAYGGDGNRSCCSLDAIDAARRTAARFDVPHWVHGVEDDFAARVIEPFVAEYEAGRTPNPCVRCNADVRFPELVRLAARQGLDRVATGHYARVVDADDGAKLLRGADRGKDQSYFLHGLGPELLSRCAFPLGWTTKPRVREAARALGLAAAARAESQEICFVPDDDRSFLFADADVAAGGEIVHADGRVLGRHRGLVHYTVGQRRGLGVADGAPLYVTALDRQRNRVIVGPRRALAVRAVSCDGFRPHGELPADGPPVDGVWTVQLRHRHAGAPVASWRRDGTRLRVVLAGPAEGVAPGQSLVLYEDERVRGGGRITTTEAAEA